MKRTRTTLTILLALSLLLIVPSAPAAEEEEDREWREEPRTVSLERTADMLRFTSSRSSELGEDELQVRYHHDTGRLEHRFTTFDTEGQGLQFIYEATIHAVIEFRDDQESGPWGLDAQAVETYRISELERGPLQRQEILQGQGYQATAEYVIPDRREEDDGPLGETSPLGDGLLRLVFTMVEQPRTVEGESLTPTGLLMDVEIVDPPYTRGDTRLAVEMSLSGTRMEDLRTKDAAIVQQAGHHESAFSWSPTTRIDGRSTEAAVTLLSFPEADAGSDQEVLLMAAYPRGDETAHTWTVQNIRYTEPVEEVVEHLARGDALLFTGALVATLAVAGPPVVNRLRRR